MIRRSWRRLVIRFKRMRTLAKIQIVASILAGFMLGYLFLPTIFSSHPPSSSSSTSSPPSGANKLAVFGMEAKETEARKPFYPPKSIRDRAIAFDSSGPHVEFVVEGKKKRLLSGAMHYFRVVPDYWGDRMLRLKAAGLNTLETYMPWNLHEPTPGKFDFTGILDIVEYVRLAQKVGLHVIVRPGPYICAEWEMGGLPAWLLRDPDMLVRSTYELYQAAVKRYFETVLPLLAPLQSAYGGPIIAFQLENEYTHYRHKDTRMMADHMKFLYELMKRLGVVELLFTSDSQFQLDKSLEIRPAEEVLMTVNFQHNKGALEKLKLLQPDKPLMVMEFWSGWFDHWGEAHMTRDLEPEEFEIALKGILQLGASVNIYMFHGGTSFGFMNGANRDSEERDLDVYFPTVSSYDYSAPVLENGALGPKYERVRAALQASVPSNMGVNTLPALPSNPPVASYGEARLTLYIPLFKTLEYLPEPHLSDKPIPMEFLPNVNHGAGQGYGYILYRTLVPQSSHSVSVSGLRDYGQALVDEVPVYQLSFFEKETFLLPKRKDEGKGQMVLDLFVENAGRVNYGLPLETRKGISKDVIVDEKEQGPWKIYSFEFKSSYLENIDSGGMWVRTPPPNHVGPALYKSTFTISGEPKDTFADMRGWGKGLLFINGANLGRYWDKGPQRTLYVPGPILRRGVNKVMVLELLVPKSPSSVVFVEAAIFDPKGKRVPLKQ